MPYTLPRLEDLFTSVDPNDGPALASRLALCKAAVADSEARTQRGEFTYLPGRMHADHPETPTMLLDRLTKSVDPDTLAGVAGQLEQLKASMADLGKDLTLTSPLSTGLIPYDLEAPAKLLTPRPTPLRNRLPRLTGQGTTREFRRILGFTGTGTGGVGYTSPRSEEHTSELQSRPHLVCRLLLEKKKKKRYIFLCLKKKKNKKNK